MRWSPSATTIPHSPLHRIKTGSSNPSVGGMKRLLARLELIEATGVLEIDVGWVNGNYQRILFHSVRTASADPGARDGGPRAGTSRWCASCTRRGATRSTKPSTCTASSSTAIAKLVETRLDDMLKAQRQAVDRIVHRYRPLGRGAARSRRRRRRVAGPTAVNRAGDAAARGPSGTPG